MAAKAGNALTRKVGPLPAWAWAASAVAVYLLYRRFAAGGTAAATTSPSSVGTGTSTVPLDTGGSAPASGGGSATDNLTGGLLALLVGNEATINSNLVTGLLGSVSTIEGLGTAALAQNGAVEQAIINGKFWGNAPTSTSTSSGGGGGGGGGATKQPTPAISTHPALSPSQAISHAEAQAHAATVKAQGYWTAGF